ncbi:MAG: TauD/TfdA family dioxygenase [Gammaproteobacteria bacterium]|nr:TauD/TfdA family dioxygenase [Gammaproteobacteria bacterium]
MNINPIDNAPKDFGALVTDFKITDASGDDIEQLTQAINRYAVLVVPGQVIDDKQQFAFSEKFGPTERATGDINQHSDRRLPMEVNDISNLDRSGQVRTRDDRARLFGLGNMLWHSDSSFKTHAAQLSLLSARVVPDSGGNTEFADMRSAWSLLDDKTQQECLNLTCMHSQIYSRGQLGFDDFTDEERAKWAPVEHPLVRLHPDTQVPSLFLSSHIGDIAGWPMPEARLFIRDLTEFATQPQFVFAHQWTQWDLVIWDNRATMHRARRYDYTQARDLHRTTVEGGPTVAYR